MRRIGQLHHTAPQLIMLVGLTVLVPLLTAGCGSSGDTLDRTLRLPLYGSTSIPDPTHATSMDQIFLASLLYSGLMKFGPDLHVIPELAVSIPTISNDGKKYTFAIRHDARFADGRRCTAADVASSFARALSPAIHSHLAVRYLGGIEGARAVEEGHAKTLSGIQIVDRLTVRIRLTRPDAAFLDKLAFPVAAVLESEGDASRDLPPGLGPWTLHGRNRAGTLELRPRPHYYGGPLQLRRLLLVPVSSPARGIVLYHKGAIDAARVPADQFTDLSSHADFSESPALDAYYVLPRSGDGAALASSLNRGRLAQQAGHAFTALEGIVPPGVPDYVSSAPPDTGSAGAARPPPVRLTLSPPHDREAARLRALLYRQWPRAQRGGLQATVLHAVFLLPDPSRWLGLLRGQTQSTWYRHIFHRAPRLTNDPVSRMTAYSRVEAWALQNGLIIPLISASTGYLVKPAVQSIQVTPLGIMPRNNTWSQVSVVGR